MSRSAVPCGEPKYVRTWITGSLCVGHAWYKLGEDTEGKKKKRKKKGEEEKGGKENGEERRRRSSSRRGGGRIWRRSGYSLGTSLFTCSAGLLAKCSVVGTSRARIQSDRLIDFPGPLFNPLSQLLPRMASLLPSPFLLIMSLDIPSSETLIPMCYKLAGTTVILS